MKTQTKTSIVIVVTLFAGILLGVLIDRTIMRHEFNKKVTGIHDPRGFMRIMERILQPEEAQYDQLMKIISEHSEKLHALGDSSRKQMEAVMDSMKMEIDPLLSAEQKARLKQRIERMHKWRKDRSGHPGPHFDKRRPGGRRPPMGRKGQHEPPPPPPLD